MDTKKCVICKNTKPVEGFDWRNKERNLRVSRCIPCQREYSKAWYRKNQIRHCEMKRQNRQDSQNKINALKSKPCLDCGLIYPSYVMDFDHVNNDKIDSVSTLLRKGCYTKALEEAKKCEAVCANCHRERTHRRITSRGRSLTAEHHPVTMGNAGSNPVVPATCNK